MNKINKQKGNIFQILLIIIAAIFAIWILMGGAGRGAPGEGPLMNSLNDSRGPGMPYAPAN